MKFTSSLTSRTNYKLVTHRNTKKKKKLLYSFFKETFFSNIINVPIKFHTRWQHMSLY